jgi:abortive infection bacteriophage resistance protein
MTRTYTKPALTYEQQIAHLRANGMVIADEAQAEYWLQHVSYYRLRAFFEPSESKGDSHRP